MPKKKDYINDNEFIRRLEEGNIKPLYLFQGEETFLIDECLERLKQSLIPAEAADFNFDKFSGMDLQVVDALAQAQTVPFLSKWRLIIITGIHQLPTEAQKQMIPYFQNPCVSTCLVMTAPKLDSRTKFAQALKQSGEFVQFWKLFDRNLPEWIMRRARSYGYSMSLQTAAYLFEFVGNDLRQLDNELKKVIAYTNTKEITPDIVQRVVGDIRERDIFELVDAIGVGNTADALRILNQLLTEGEQPLRILAMVSRQFRLLWKTKAHLVEHKSLSPNQLAGKIGVSTRSAQTLQRQVQRFSQVKLKQGVKRLYDVDLALKSSTNSPKILLEDLFIDLCM